MKHTHFKTIIFLITLSIIWSCSPSIEEPEVIDDRARMLEVMDYTAQVVSQVMISNEARQEILGYALEENAGEVEASFAELLSEITSQRSLINNAETGNFAAKFRPKAERYQFEQNQFKKSKSADDIISDLESYLKDNNLGVFGPYLAEYHSDSDKPITVSFDPLDDSRTTNYGYVITRKTNHRSSANNTGIDVPKVSLDEDYELTLIEDIDDAYAQENPTLVIVEIDGPGGPTIPPAGGTGDSNSTQPLPIPSTGIRCDDLRDGDILRPFMVKFRLIDNLRGGFWNRNLLNLYAITKDDVSFDINNDAVVNPGTSKYWNEYRVSRADANNGKWLTATQRLDSNWLLDEDNLTIAVSYKKTSVTVDKIEVGVKGAFAGTPSGSVTATLDFDRNQNLLFSESYDKCATIALFNSSSLAGELDGLAIEKFGKMEFTLDMDWRR